MKPILLIRQGSNQRDMRGVLGPVHLDIPESGVGPADSPGGKSADVQLPSRSLTQFLPLSHPTSYSYQ